MINFFRQMRRNLTNEDQTPGKAGRFLQYFRYAIGEIILVMVGILLALQVNTWNENRKQEKRRDYYLKALIIDLRENVEYLQERNEKLYEEITFQKTLEDRLESPLANIDTVVATATNEVSLLYYSFSPLNNNTYQTLVSTGHIEYFEPWLIEYLQQLDFLHSNLVAVNASLSREYGIVLKDFLEVYPKTSTGKILSDHLAEIATNDIPVGRRISVLNSFLWVKGGAYHSLLRRSEPLEEQTKHLLDTLKLEYPFLKD